MEKKVDIKFNATDGGSFEKFASKYRDVLKSMSGSNNYKQNSKYVTTEMQKELDFYNEKIKKEKELYNIKVTAMKDLANKSQADYNNYKNKVKEIDNYKPKTIRTKDANGNWYGAPEDKATVDKYKSDQKKIALDEYQAAEEATKKKEKDLLKGTGKRSWGSYDSGFTKSITSAEELIGKKASFMDETNDLLRNILNQDRETATKTIKDINSNKNATEAEKMAAELADQQIQHEKAHQPKEKNVVNSILSVDNLKKFVSNIASYGDSKNGFDSISSIGSNVGQLGGTIIGGAIGSLIGPEGTILGANIGSIFGEMIGKAAGKIEQTALMTQQQFYKDANSYKATTGNAVGDFESVSSIGMTSSQFVQLQRSVALSIGSSLGAGNNAYSAAMLNKGFGVENGTSNQILELARSMNKTDRDLYNIVGGVWHQGQGVFKGDRTFLNEFLNKNFSSLERTLLKNQTNVKSGTTLDILSRFNSMGGQFDAKNPNSIGLIEQINSSLINPTSANADALSFNALRRLHPNEGIFDLRKERQKGLNSPGYLQAMMRQVDQIGGSTDMKKMNLAGLLGLNDNLNAVDTLYSHRANILSGNFSQEELKADLSKDGIKGMAEKNTIAMESNEAKLNEAFLQGSKEAVKQIADNIRDSVEKAFDGSQVVIINGKVKLTTTINSTKKPVSKYAPIQVAGDQTAGGAMAPFN